jgi:hypothetical protein
VHQLRDLLVLLPGLSAYRHHPAADLMWRGGCGSLVIQRVCTVGPQSCLATNTCWDSSWRWNLMPRIYLPPCVLWISCDLEDLVSRPSDSLGRTQRPECSSWGAAAGGGGGVSACGPCSSVHLPVWVSCDSRILTRGSNPPSGQHIQPGGRSWRLDSKPATGSMFCFCWSLRQRDGIPPSFLSPGRVGPETFTAGLPYSLS